MKQQPFKRIECLLSALIYIFAVFCTAMTIPATAEAAPATSDEQQQEQETRMELPVQSNQIENWPQGPSVGAQGAIVLEADTDVILYSKNIHEKLYPASTTKLMTCLIAAEHCSMDEMVTFSREAVFGIEQGSSNIGIDVGQAMPMEECLYGILTASANEVAAAVAEHVAGSQEAFADMMNEKAKELGCSDTHFANPHGLFEEDHYTSPYDLAIIAKAFFQNELLAKIGNTASHHFVATKDQPDDFVSRNKHQLITGEIPYEGIKGGKTGYTDEAGQTLVTCAERNGMRLICVVMKEESPQQFLDTVKLLDYGFQNFTVTNVAENETKYTIDNAGFFHTSYDVFGNSKPVLSLNQDSSLILPKTAEFEELTSEISYDTAKEGEAARIDYYYHGAFVGTAGIDLINEPGSYADSTDPNIIFINIRSVLLVVIIIAVLLILISLIHDIVKNYSFFSRHRRRRRYRTAKKKNKDNLKF